MTVVESEFLLLDDYSRLDSLRVFAMINRLGVWVMIGGDVLKAIFQYPTEEQVLSREGGSADGKTLRALLRVPELFIHRESGIFKVGTKARVLCSRNLPNFVLGEFFYNEGAIYRVSLHHEQAKPTDTGERGWR